MKRPIYLMGFMGCGKSHMGSSLAKVLHRPFLDLDERIETIAGMSIPELFPRYEEQAFRHLEAFALRTTGQESSAIIALGGGTPCFFENMDWIRRHGRSIFLDTHPAILLERLKGQRKNRPLLNQFTDEELEAKISRQLEQRRPFYEQANFTLSIEKEERALKELKELIQEVVL